MRCLYLVVCILLMTICGCDNSGKTTDKIGYSMPSISLLQLDSVSSINTDRLPDSVPNVLIFFDPYCEFCRAETGSIIKNLKSFGNTHFCFLSIAPINDIKSFYSHFELRKYSNISIGLDTGAVYIRYFSATQVPHTSVYEKGKKLKAVFTSGTNAEEILAKINYNK